jgi:hypothetical protein
MRSGRSYCKLNSIEYHNCVCIVVKTRFETANAEKCGTDLIQTFMVNEYLVLLLYSKYSNKYGGRTK